MLRDGRIFAASLLSYLLAYLVFEIIDLMQKISFCR
jgi:hypothetical protein